MSSAILGRPAVEVVACSCGREVWREGKCMAYPLCQRKFVPCFCEDCGVVTGESDVPFDFAARKWVACRLCTNARWILGKSHIRGRAREEFENGALLVKRGA